MNLSSKESMLSRNPEMMTQFSILERALQARKKYKELMIYGYDFQFIDLDMTRSLPSLKSTKTRRCLLLQIFSGEEIGIQPPKRTVLLYLLFLEIMLTFPPEFLKPWGKLESTSSNLKLVPAILA
nr:AKR_HP1_G0033580.mRNA.1.CDS.1 [Saccharomyces cerevisiae]